MEHLQTSIIFTFHRLVTVSNIDVITVTSSVRLIPIIPDVYIVCQIFAMEFTFLGVLILLSDASAIFVFNFNIFLRSTLIWLSPIMLRGYNCFSMIHHLEVLRRFVDFSRKYNICSCFRVSISILVFYSLNCLFTGLLVAIFNFPVLLIVSACRSPQGI